MATQTIGRISTETSKRDADNESCQCGVKDCTGHEVIDGKVTIPHHPHGHVVIQVDEEKKKS